MTLYTSQTIAGYNSSPPSDDGAATESNKGTWDGVKTKLSDPVKTLAEAINTQLITSFAGGVVSSTGDGTITSTGITTLQLTSTEDGSGVGPNLKLNRNSATPIDDDYIGGVFFYGNNDAAESVQYARVFGRELSVVDGSEDGALYFSVMRGGVQTTSAIIDDDEVYLRGTKGVTIAEGDLSFSTAGKGVYLGVTTATAANLLDDYEEGTWTCTIAASGGSFSAGAQTATGVYTKVGRDVHVQVYMGSKDTTGTSGNLSFTGLPFAPSEISIGHIGLYSLGATNSTGAWARVVSGSTDILPYINRDGTTWAQTTISAGTSRVAHIDIYYTV